MKVIVAIDDTPSSCSVIESLLNRPWPKDVSFKLLTVLEPICECLNEDTIAPFSDTLAAIDERRRRAALTMSNRIAKKIHAKLRQAKVASEIREGMPRIEIINAAVEWSADLILMGAHGVEVCPRNLLGSVSRAVVNHAPCTVEVVRPSPRKARAGKGHTQKVSQCK